MTISWYNALSNSDCRGSVCVQLEKGGGSEVEYCVGCCAISLEAPSLHKLTVVAQGPTAPGQPGGAQWAVHKLCTDSREEGRTIMIQLSSLAQACSPMKARSMDPSILDILRCALQVGTLFSLSVSLSQVPVFDTLIAPECPEDGTNALKCHIRRGCL